LTTEKSRESGHHTSRQELGSGKDAFFLDDIKVLEPLTRRHICEHSGCNRKGYSKYEHLKRHQNEQV